MYILILFLLMLLNGIFAMFEMAIVSVNRLKLIELQKSGHKKANLVLNLSKDSTKFFTILQLGVTLLSIIIGMYSNENMAIQIKGFLKNYILNQYLLNILSQFVVLIFTTFFFVLLGEIIPKKIGVNYAENVALYFAPFVYLFAIIISPLSFLLTNSGNFILKILKVKNKSANITSEEIKLMIKNSVDTGLITQEEQTIVNNVFSLKAVRVNSIFTYKSKVDIIDNQFNLKELIHFFIKKGHAYYPVCDKNNPQEINGVIHVNDLLLMFHDNTNEIKNYIKKPLVVNENLYVTKVLELFKKYTVKFAIVINEYGNYIGVISQSDILNSLISFDDAQNSEDIIKQSEMSWIIGGQLTFRHFIEYISKFFPQEKFSELKADFAELEQDNINTFGGYFLNKTPNYFEIGVNFKKGNFDFKIIKISGVRIEKILVTKIKNKT